MLGRLVAPVVAIAVVAGLNACGDPTTIDADFTNIDTSRTVYAFSGTPASLPSALLIRGAAPVRLDPSYSFDLAFDINSANQVIAYSVRKLASQITGTHRVGLQFTDEAYSQVTAAPKTGYVYDSTYVIPLGRVFLIDVVDPSCSQFSLLGPNIRAKAVIDSVNLLSRAIYLHILANPNCGFVTLTPGVPPE